MSVALPTSASGAASPAATGSISRAKDWVVGHADVVLACAVGIVTLLLYARSAWFVFVNFDDAAYVYSNPDLPLGLSWAGLHYAFTAHQPYWHPLVWIINLVVYGRFGMRPGPYHIVNFCFAAGAAALLALFWVRATGNRWAGVVAAALWAWHPLRVESVVWISETKDISAAFFWILAMLLYVRYVRRPSGWWYAAVSAAYACALCCKPSVVTFPFALLLLDVWPLRRVSVGLGKPAAPGERGNWNRIILEKLPWLAMAAVVARASYVAQSSGRAMTYSRALPLAARVENAAISYLWYVGKTFWPTHLAIFYPHPYLLYHAISAWHWAPAAGGLLVITLVAVVLWRAHPAALVGWLWFLGILVPMIGLVQVGVQGMADRHSLIPSIGLVAGVVWPVAEVLRGRSRVVSSIVTAAVVVLLAAELAASSVQIGYWRNTATVFSHATEVVPDNYMTAALLAEDYAVDAAKHGEAQRLAELAVRVAPDQAPPHEAMGVVLDSEGDYRGAAHEYERAARLNPTTVQYCNEVGREEIQLGRYDEAMEWYQAAARIAPDDATAQHNVALCLAHQGKLDKAMALWQQLLRAHPGYDAAHTRLAEALQRKGDLHGAAAHYRAAVALGEKDATVEANYAWCVGTDPGATAEQVQQVLPVAKDAVDQTKQNDALALDAYAAVLARAGQFDDAVAAAARAVACAADKPTLARAIMQREAEYRAGQPFLMGGR